MKADLHYHGTIGFHEPWMSLQGYNGKNICELVLNSAVKKGIDIIVITSEQNRIVKNSCHDRFNYLFSKAQNLSDKYSFDKLGSKDIAFYLERKEDGKKLFVLNGQTVVVREGDKRFDHLVIGSNQVSNGMNLIDTLCFGHSEGLLQIAEHPYMLAHFGIGDKLEEYLSQYDAVEGHNSQMILPFGSISKKSNELAQILAKQKNKPWIATSDGHRVQDVGVSYISFDDFTFDNEEQLLRGLKQKVYPGNFENHCEYQNLFGWADWVSKYVIATYSGFDKDRV